MKLKHINVQQFLSLQNIELSVPEKGIIFVEGENQQVGGSNGAGKSALLESIFYTLYGRTIRGISVSDAKTSVLLSDEASNSLISIHRTPKGASINSNLKELGRPSWAKRDSQGKINLLLGMTYKTFQMITYFTPLTISRWFVEFTDTERKEMFSDLLDLGLLDIAQKLVKVDRDRREAELVRTSTRLSEIRNLMGSLSEKKSSTNYSQKIQENLTLLKNQYNFEISKDEVLEVTAKAKQILNEERNALYQLDKNKHQIEMQIRTVNSNLITVSNLTTCPYCLQQVSEAHKKTIEERLTKELEQLNRDFFKASEEYMKKYKDLSGFEEVVKILDETERLIQLEAASSTNYGLIIEDYKKEIPSLEEKIRNLEKEVLTLKIWEKIFSPTGIKAKILEDFISIISERMSNYSSILGIDCGIQINEKGKIDYTLDYKALSSGERRKVEIALLFALRSTIVSPVDILIIDEVFDHLDNQSLELVNLILRDFVDSYNIPVFVVSHKSDLVLDYDYKVKVIKNKNGVTDKIEVIQS